MILPTLEREACESAQNYRAHAPRGHAALNALRPTLLNAQGAGAAVHGRIGIAVTAFCGLPSMTRSL